MADVSRKHGISSATLDNATLNDRASKNDDAWRLTRGCGSPLAELRGEPAAGAGKAIGVARSSMRYRPPPALRRSGLPLRLYRGGLPVKDKKLRRLYAEECLPVLWGQKSRVESPSIAPGKPVQNAFIESGNGGQRDQLANETRFASMAHASGPWRTGMTITTRCDRTVRSAICRPLATQSSATRRCHRTGRSLGGYAPAPLLHRA